MTGFRSSKHLHWLLAATALLVPTLLFAGAAWKSRVDALNEGEASLLNAVAVLSEEIRGQLHVQELALTKVSDYLREFSWSEIESAEVSRFLAGLSASLDEVSSFRIADDVGVVRAASYRSVLGSHVGETAILHAVGATGQHYISMLFTGILAQPISLSVIERRITADGRFDGTIYADVAPAALAALFSRVSLLPHDVMLIQSEDTPGRGQSDQSTLLPPPSTIEANPTGGVPKSPDTPVTMEQSFGPTHRSTSARMYSMAHVPGYPVWVRVGVDRSTVLEGWYHSLLAYGAAAGVGAIALLLASWIAIRRASAEQAAFALLHAETACRLRMEERMREAHRLEAVGQLAAGVAHDFNNLLAAVMGNLELIAAGVADKQVWASVARARKAVERGARLTASLLSFARRQLLQTDTYDVNLLIRDFVPVIRQSVGPSIKVDLQLEPQLPRCRVDVAHFEAALLNLVINARDAMSDKGTLTFSTRRTTLSAEDLCNNHEATPGIFVAISVADNGTGMPADVTTKAFEPFFTTKQIGQGSGLGLSYVFGFVRQLGGHVRMESVSGCGTVVTLLLPERS